MIFTVRLLQLRLLIRVLPIHRYRFFQQRPCSRFNQTVQFIVLIRTTMDDACQTRYNIMIMLSNSLDKCVGQTVVCVTRRFLQHLCLLLPDACPNVPRTMLAK